MQLNTWTAATAPWRLLAGAVVIGLSSVAWSHGSPATSAPDAELPQRLPEVSGADGRLLRRLHQRLADEPTDVDVAIRFATHALRIGQSSGDERFYGYAETALRPWRNEARPEPAVLVLRATVRQHRHDFAGALADLNQALAEEPRNAQAWLSRAVILSVRGEYAAAWRSCLPLAGRVSRLLIRTCLSHAEVLNGQAQRGYRLLAQAVQDSPNAPVQERLWALTVLAETADRLGRVATAERHFQQALALERRDRYLLAAYADFLLDERRFEDVLDRLAGPPLTEGLLLRRILAERALGRGSWSQHLSELEQSMAGSRQRGVSLHQREEARAHLHLLDRPEEALILAEANWQVQREPWDARLVLEAALASGSPQAAGPVLDWLDRTGLEDRHLRSLAARAAAMTRGE